MALAREGVITTAGWKRGTQIATNRAVECIEHHIHVYTHFARLSEVDAAAAFAEKNDWIPSVDEQPVAWNDIPHLAKEYEEGNIESYYPVFKVN